MKFRSRRNLGRRLRENRPSASDELVNRIVADLDSSGRQRRTRLGLACATTVLLALGLATTGSIGYAASAVSAAPAALKQLVKPKKDAGSRAAAANAGKVTICHIPPGNPSNAHLITISSNAVAAHRRHGDPAPGASCPRPGPPDDQYKDKVLVCHVPPGNPGNRHEIFISSSAVPAHLAHGDDLGACTRA